MTNRCLYVLVALMLLTGVLIASTAAEEILYPNIEVVEIVNTLAPVQLAPDSTPSVESTSAPKSMTRLGFEDGFSLEFPESWLIHTIDGEMAKEGVIYALSDAACTNYLYIQSLQSDCANADELKAMIDRTTKPQVSEIYSFNGYDFVVYDLSDSDVSCCATLLDGQMLNFVFTPQSDTEFMGTAAQIIGSFARIHI